MLAIPTLLLALMLGGDGASASVPPPQRSLDVPPLIDPSRTAVLTGVVPIKSSPDAAVPDGLRSVVWVVKPAAARSNALPRQVMVLSNWGFRPATVVATPRTEIELRNSESAVRVVKGSGALTFERRLNRATAATPVVAQRAGVIELKALAAENALETSGAIVVVDTPFAAVAGANGEFQIVGLPPGRNTVKFRLPDGKEFERTVELRAGGELVVDWRDAATPPPSAPSAPARPTPAPPPPPSAPAPPASAPPPPPSPAGG